MYDNLLKPHKRYIVSKRLQLGERNGIVEELCRVELRFTKRNIDEFLHCLSDILSYVKYGYKDFVFFQIYSIISAPYIHTGIITVTLMFRTGNCGIEVYDGD